MRRNNYKKNVIFIVILFIIILTMSGAYAILSATLNMSYGSITQQPLSFNVGFVAGSYAGESNIDAFGCGTAYTSTSTVTLTSVDLYYNHVCTYKLSIKNYGTVGARLSKITNNYPSNYSSTQCSGTTSLFSCNITNKYTISYKICTDSNCSSLVKAGSNSNALYINPNSSQYIYLKVSVAGTKVDTEKQLSGGGFKLTFSGV